MRVIKLLLVLILSFMLFACSAQKAEDTRAFDAKGFTQVLLTGDASSLDDEYAFTDEMVSALGDDGLVLLQSQLKALGTLQSVGEPKVSEMQGYTVYSVPCVHSYQNFDLVISIDADGKIAGIVMGNYSNDEVADLSFLNEEEVSFGDEYKISGTLTLPKAQSYPCVIMLSGSGPNDRDETIGANKPFQDLAIALQDKGIASLRFDKRTYSYADECASDIDFTIYDEIVNDAVSAYKFIKERDDITSVYILGHSLGGQVLPLVAENIDADGYIYLAAPARDFLVLLKEQLDYLRDFQSAEDLSPYYKQIDRLKDLDTLKDDELVLGAYKAYWQSLLDYDQVQKAKDIKVPQLFLQGEEDYQVTMEDFKIWQDEIAEATFISYQGLTHIFQRGDKSEGPGVYTQKGSIDDKVIEDIVAFIDDH